MPLTPQHKIIYPLRLPRELHKWVKLQADTNSRSFNGEVIFTLQQAKLKAEQGAGQ